MIVCYSVLHKGTLGIVSARKTCGKVDQNLVINWTSWGFVHFTTDFSKWWTQDQIILTMFPKQAEPNFWNISETIRISSFNANNSATLNLWSTSERLGSPTDYYIISGKQIFYNPIPLF